MITRWTTSLLAVLGLTLASAFWSGCERMDRPGADRPSREAPTTPDRTETPPSTQTPPSELPEQEIPETPDTPR